MHTLAPKSIRPVSIFDAVFYVLANCIKSIRRKKWFKLHLIALKLVVWMHKWNWIWIFPEMGHANSTQNSTFSVELACLSFSMKVTPILCVRSNNKVCNISVAQRALKIIAIKAGMFNLNFKFLLHRGRFFQLLNFDCW